MADVVCMTSAAGLEYADNRITSVAVAPTAGGEGAEETVYPADVVISSIPLQELVADVRGSVPEDVLHVARGLAYRDFMTVGIVLRTSERLADLKDNWIYVQEPDVHMGRIQIFNNWSPYLAKDRQTLLLGLEYFCSEGDSFWTMDDRDFIAMAAGELEKIGLARKEDVLEAFVVRVPKAYPAYFGSYERIGVLQKWLNSVQNLYPVGRNGMHRYNNMDHSMLSALRTVDCLAGKSVAKADVWQVNAEKEYVLSWDGNCLRAYTRSVSDALSSLLRSPLRSLSVGTRLGEMKGKDLVPAHELALSADVNPDAFPAAEVDWAEAIRYLRKEALTLPPSVGRGYVLLRYRGFPLGFVKNLGNRANNLYPQEWRIRSGHLPEEVRLFEGGKSV